MEKISEVELAKYFIEYLKKEDYELFFEVPAAGIIDIVAVKDNLISSIEVKTQFSFSVLEQAFRNIKYCDYSYIAVPDTTSNIYIKKEICKQLGIGILVYRKVKVNYHFDRYMIKNNLEYYKYIITELIKPKLNVPVHKIELKDFLKENIAGSKNERITNFSNSITEIEKLLKKNNGMKIKDLVKISHFHWSNSKSAYSGIIKGINKGYITTLKLEKGFLTLK